MSWAISFPAHFTTIINIVPTLIAAKYNATYAKSFPCYYYIAIYFAFDSAQFAASKIP